MVLRSVRFSMSGWNADDRIWSLYMSHFIYYFTYLGLLVCWRVSYSFHVKIITLRVMIIVFVCAYVYVLSYNCWMNNFSNHLFILYCVCFKSFREVHVLLVASHIWFLLKFFICGLMLLSLSLDWWWLIQFHRLSRFVVVHQKLTPLLIPVFFICLLQLFTMLRNILLLLNLNQFSPPKNIVIESIWIYIWHLDRFAGG